MSIQVTSAAFADGEMIPTQYTCEGEDISPDLSWAGIPQGAKTIALICDDPDAPRGTFVHWVLYNVPGDMTGLPEKIPSLETLENGVKQGRNDFPDIGYRGPCPPSGIHRYYFKVYALDSVLDLKPGATKAHLENAMQGHIMAQGQLTGKYKKRGH